MSDKREAVDTERRLRDAVGQLLYLVGCTIEALETYDSDDGHNALVLAGIVAEIKRIEDMYLSEMTVTRCVAAASLQGE